MPQRIEPGPGQESVWDYPRPPRVEQVRGLITVVLGGETIVTTEWAHRVLETSHPPTYYLPIAAFVAGCLAPARAGGGSMCEWKGRAAYFDLSGGGMVRERAAWGYPEPRPEFEDLRGCLALYAGKVDRCTVDGEVVVPQPGGFYGGWITARVVGPFKGEPGTMGW